MPVIPFPNSRVNAAPSTSVNSAKPAPKPQRRPKNELDAERRRFMIAKVKIAQKQIGMDDDTYHAMLDELFGVESCTKLNNEQLHKLILHFQKCGWQAKRGSARRGADRKRGVPSNLQREPLMRKIEALLAEKGREEGTLMPWAYAVGILKKQTRGAGGEVKALEHATGEQLCNVIAALVRDAQRKGRYVEQWGRDVTDYEAQPTQGDGR